MAGNMEVSLLVRVKDQASAALNRIKQAATQNADQSTRASVDGQRKVQTACRETSQAFGRNMASQSQLSQRAAQTRAQEATRAENTIQRELAQTESAHRRVGEAGATSARAQQRAFANATTQARALRSELQGVAQQQERMGGGRLAGAAGVVAGGWAASQVLKAPLERARQYDLALGYATNTAYAGGSKQDRLKGKETIRQAVATSVNQGGGSREASLEAYNKLVGSGQYSAAEAASMLGRIMRFSTANEVNPTEAADLTLAAKQFGFKPEQLETFFDQSVASGQKGGFEVKNQAAWLARQSATASRYGMRGEKDFAELLTLNQMSKTTAGSADQAGNNANNLMGKILAPDTVGDFKKQGIDLTGTIAKARAEGHGVISAFMFATNQVAMKDKKYAALAKQLEATSDKDIRKELMLKQAKILEGSAIGKVLQDSEAMAAYVGWAGNKAQAKEIFDASRADKAKGANQDNWAVIGDSPEVQRQRREAAAQEAGDKALSGLVSTIGQADKALADYAVKYPGLSTATMAATYALTALSAAAAGSALMQLLGGGKAAPVLARTLGAAVPAAKSAVAVLGTGLGAAAMTPFVMTSSVKQEEGGVLGERGRWGAIKARYSQAQIDTARDQYQPWYQFGRGNAEENQQYLKQAEKDKLPGFNPDDFIQKQQAMFAQWFGTPLKVVVEVKNGNIVAQLNQWQVTQAGRR